MKYRDRSRGRLMSGAFLFGTILILKKYVLRFPLNRDTIKKWGLGF